jgi:hypothetical protein
MAGAGDDPGGKARMGKQVGSVQPQRNKAHTLTVLGSPRNGEVRWPDQVVDMMSAKGRRSLQVDGLGVSLAAWSSRTRRARIRTGRQGAQKLVEPLLPIPIPAQPVCSTWSDFPTGGGDPCLSCHVLPCLPSHHAWRVCSKAATCVRQTMCTADRNIPLSQLFTLPCLHVIFFSCMSNKLFSLTYA